MKYGIKIMPREVILDTQGRVIETHLKTQGYHVQSLRVGKYIEIEVSATDTDKAQQEIQAMMKNGLYNPLIENYEIQDVKDQ